MALCENMHFEGKRGVKEGTSNINIENLKQTMSAFAEKDADLQPTLTGRKNLILTLTKACTCFEALAVSLWLPWPLSFNISRNTSHTCCAN